MHCSFFPLSIKTHVKNTITGKTASHGSSPMYAVSSRGKEMSATSVNNATLAHIHAAPVHINAATIPGNISP